MTDRTSTSHAHLRFGMLSVFALVLVATITAVLGVPGRSSAASGSSGGPGIFWGAQIGDQLTGEQAPWDMKAVYKFERLVGKKVSLINFNAPFETCQGSRCSFNGFPSEPMEDLRTAGIVPIFSWSSSSGGEGAVDSKFTLAKIIHGKYDSYIREFAESAAAWGHPFFLRFDWEMNGNWFPWSEEANGNRRGEFVTAWRHVHDIFDSVGATNATWVWCPNVGYAGHLRSLYPGNQYVDWTCLDGYNWGTSFKWAHWQSFRNVFKSSYEDVQKIAPEKPVMLGEVASTKYGGSKPGWITEMLSTIPREFPKVRAVNYFDVEDRGTKWPVEKPASVRNAFAKGIRNPEYVGSEFSELTANPIAPPRR